MPFGSVPSVHAFCRLSLFVRTVLVKMLGIVTIGYFDDFPMVDARASKTCGSASFSAEEVMQLLGIR
eukprot:5090655-Amphidinium_carterae.1